MILASPGSSTGEKGGRNSRGIRPSYHDKSLATSRDDMSSHRSPATHDRVEHEPVVADVQEVRVLSFPGTTHHVWVQLTTTSFWDSKVSSTVAIPELHLPRIKKVTMMARSLRELYKDTILKGALDCNMIHCLFVRCCVCPRMVRIVDTVFSSRHPFDLSSRLGVCFV